MTASDTSAPARSPPRSDGLIGVASTRMSTWLGPGSGTSISSRYTSTVWSSLTSEYSCSACVGVVCWHRRSVGRALGRGNEIGRARIAGKVLLHFVHHVAEPDTPLAIGESRGEPPAPACPNDRGPMSGENGEGRKKPDPNRVSWSRT